MTKMTLRRYLTKSALDPNLIFLLEDIASSCRVIANRVRNGAFESNLGSADATNTSRYRYWETPVRRYVDECVAGEDGIRGRAFNMRWTASMVAEIHRILTRGGVFYALRITTTATLAAS